MDKKGLIELYTTLGKYGKKYYHNIPELGLTGGPRDFDHRIKNMHLDKIDFKNKTVLDLGCAGGNFSRYAIDKGAKKVDALDYFNKGSKDPIFAAKVINDYLIIYRNTNYKNITFYNYDLNTKHPIKEFSIFRNYDIVFLFSMTFHLQYPDGVPDWLSDITRGVCIVEDNSKGRTAIHSLNKYFKKVNLVGYVNDRGEEKDKLPVYHCYPN